MLNSTYGVFDMIELEKLQAELKAIDDEVKAVQSKRGAVRDRLATLCPIQIGDVVECNGFSHTGKKMVVEHVSYKPMSWSKSLWVCSGTILKKDGSPSKHVGEHRV